MALTMMGPLPDRVIQVLQDFLPEELDQVDIEMADGIVTPDIEERNYFNRDRRVIANYPALTIRIVASNPIEVRPKQFGSRVDAKHDLEVIVHVVASQGDAETLQALMARYAAGIIRVLCIQRERLGTTLDPAAFVDIVEWLRPISYSPMPTQTEGAIVRSVTIPLSIRRREVRV
jgi:hypothetical protein